MSDSSSDLIPRLLTAAVGIPILLYLIFWAPAWGFFGLVVAAGGISVWEYCSMTYGDSHVPARWVATAAGGGILTTTFFAPDWTLEAFVGAVMLVAAFVLLTFPDREASSRQIAFSIMALVFGGLFVGLLLPLHALPHGAYWIMITLVTVWMGDTGAYFVGRAVGNTSLYAPVSPNKSVEGAIGGLAGSLVGASACNWGFPSIGAWPTISFGSLALLVIPAGILAQMGDLVVSLIKRAHEVKDSGSILYGHGGLLDRIDGLIFAAPWFYVCVVYVLQ